LDGETNLKHKTSLKELFEMMGDSEAKVCKFNARLICDEPNEDLYRFVGTIKPAD
jgi:hypothetical protein